MEKEFKAARKDNSAQDSLDLIVLEWVEEQFCGQKKILLDLSGQNIHKIALKNGKRIYVVPEAWYMAAADLIREKKTQKAGGSEDLLKG
ncbi:MAG: hypothetical protein COA94_03325 [Rickettsiales bacterium]|nr:MAG: hypothetical protein COA94_03325 [Rickettsiales bacterium]